ncbi:MAG: hypothetical protein ACHQVS_00760 [Candidatus Babeliales bacterium]
MHPIEELFKDMDKLKDLLYFVVSLPERDLQDKFTKRFDEQCMDYILQLALEGNYEHANKVVYLMQKVFEKVPEILEQVTKEYNEDNRSAEEDKRTKAKKRRTKSKST